jgi:hypothetical protein
MISPLLIFIFATALPVAGVLFHPFGLNPGECAAAGCVAALIVFALADYRKSTASAAVPAHTPLSSTRGPNRSTKPTVHRRRRAAMLRAA